MPLQPGLELGIALEDQLQSLAHDVIEVVGAEGLGVVLHGQGARFLDACEVPALGDRGCGRFQSRHGFSSVGLRFLYVSTVDLLGPELSVLRTRDSLKVRLQGERTVAGSDLRSPK